jgi:hypothetical protein
MVRRMKLDTWIIDYNNFYHHPMSLERRESYKKLLTEFKKLDIKIELPFIILPPKQPDPEDFIYTFKVIKGRKTNTPLKFKDPYEG